VSAATPSLFGFEVRSSTPFRFLRAGGGVETLEIVTATQERTRPATAPLTDATLPGTNHTVRATLYEVDGGYEFWTTDAGGYRIEPERGRIEIPPAADEVVREQRLWGTPAVLCFMHRGDFPLHAAAVEVGGGAVLLAAPPLHGKTTLALAFHRNGFRVLSEDLACCRMDPSPALLPGPAVLRLRPDVYDGRPPAGTHLVLDRPDRLYVALDDDRKGSCAPVPIRAVVFLRQAEEQRMERVPPAGALTDLWALNFRLRTSEGRSQSFSQLSKLAALPLWNLHRPLRMEALDQTVAEIAEHL
jgi:hypothetical protein